MLAIGHFSLQQSRSAVTHDTSPFSMMPLLHTGSSKRASDPPAGTC
jgi:hypothetical protein